MRELANDRAGLGILDEEAHEAQRVVVGAPVRRKEKVARKWRNRGDDWVAHHDRAALGDLNALVDIRPRILAADDVFRRREEPPEREQHEGCRNQRGPGDALGCRSKPKTSAGGGSAEPNQEHVGVQQPRKRIAVNGGEPEHDR